MVKKFNIVVETDRKESEPILPTILVRIDSGESAMSININKVCLLSIYNDGNIYDYSDNAIAELKRIGCRVN